MFVHRRAGVNRSGVTASSRRDADFAPSCAPAASGLAARPARPRGSPSWCWSLVAAVLVLRGPSISQGFIDRREPLDLHQPLLLDHLRRPRPVRPGLAAELPRLHPPAGRALPDRLRPLAPGLAAGSAQRPLRQPPEPGRTTSGRATSRTSTCSGRRAGSRSCSPSRRSCWSTSSARILGGSLAGVAAAALALVNPLLTTVWTRALAESIVAAFGLLALALALLRDAEGRNARRSELAAAGHRRGAGAGRRHQAERRARRARAGRSTRPSSRAWRCSGRAARCGLRSWVDVGLSRRRRVRGGQSAALRHARRPHRRPDPAPPGRDAVPALGLQRPRPCPDDLTAPRRPGRPARVRRPTPRRAGRCRSRRTWCWCRSAWPCSAGGAPSTSAEGGPGRRSCSSAGSSPPTPWSRRTSASTRHTTSRRWWRSTC